MNDRCGVLVSASWRCTDGGRRCVDGWRSGWRGRPQDALSVSPPPPCVRRGRGGHFILSFFFFIKSRLCCNGSTLKVENLLANPLTGVTELTSSA